MLTYWCIAREQRAAEARALLAVRERSLAELRDHGFAPRGSSNQPTGAA